MTISIHNPRASLLLTGLIIALVSACSSLPELPVTQQSEQNWQLRRQQLAAIDHWQIYARAVISLHAENPQQDELYSVGINWNRQQARFSMTLEAPFGQGMVRIESNQSEDATKRFKLTLADGKYHLGSTPEALLTDLFGWSVPLSGLKSWVKGAPQPGLEYSYELYGEGRLKSMRQAGWLINYLAYFPPDKQARQLPKRIYLKRNNLAIKIAIKRWTDLKTPVQPESIFPDFG